MPRLLPLAALLCLPLPAAAIPAHDTAGTLTDPGVRVEAISTPRALGVHEGAMEYLVVITVSADTRYDLLLTASAAVDVVLNDEGHRVRAGSESVRVVANGGPGQRVEHGIVLRLPLGTAPPRLHVEAVARL
jgi:hypothetical protein